MPSTDKKNYVIAFLACTTLGGAALVIHTRQQLADARNAPSLQINRTEITTAAAPAPIVSPPVEPAPATPTEAAPTPQAAGERPEGGPGGPGNRGQRGAQFAAQMAALMQDPEFAAAWKLEQEARIEQRYGSLFKQLNLSPDKLTALKSLLVERENAGREVWASAAAQGLNPRDNRDQLRELTDSLESEVDKNIEAQLGASVVTALDTYNSTSSQRNTVNDLSQKLNYAGQTLNDSQAQQLTKILAETGAQNGRTTTITDDTIDRARGVLTLPQLAELKRLQAEQEARRIIEEKTRAARQAMNQQGGGGGGGQGRNRQNRGD